MIKLPISSSSYKLSTPKIEVSPYPGGRGIEGVTAAGGGEKLGLVPDPDAGGGGANVAASDPPNREPLEPPPNSDPPELGVNNDGAAVVATTGGGGAEIIGIGFGTALVVAMILGVGRGVVGTVGAGLGALVVRTKFSTPFALIPLLPRASGLTDGNPRPKFEDPKLPVLVLPIGSSPPGIPVGPTGLGGCFGPCGIRLFGPPLPGGGIGPPPIAITASETEPSEESIDSVQNIGTKILHPISSETRIGSKAKAWAWTKTEPRSELSCMSMKSPSKMSVPMMMMMAHWSAIIIVI